MGSDNLNIAYKIDESASTSLDEKNSLGHGDLLSNGFMGEKNESKDSAQVSTASKTIGNVQSVPCIYRQDVVRSNKSGVIGIVSEVAGDSDSDDSMTEDEDEEDGDEEEEDEDEEAGDANECIAANSNENRSSRNYKRGTLQADQIRVNWMDHTDPVQYANAVTVVDRAFLLGAYVAAASDTTGQVSVIVGVNVSVDLLAPDGSTVKDVSSEDLRRVRDFTVGDYVVLGRWLGRIHDVLDNVTVMFDDGSVCKVMRAEPFRLKPCSRTTLEDEDRFPYYPGQRVKANSSSVFKDCRWLSGRWKANRLEGTVTRVTAGAVFIHWIASAGYGSPSSTAPAEEQKPKNLKLLSCIADANWQVGNWCLLSSLFQSSSTRLRLDGAVKNKRGNCQLEGECNLQENSADAPDDCSCTKTLPESSSCSNSMSVSKESVHVPWPLYRKKSRMAVIGRDKRARKKEESFERALMVVNRRTKVGLAWQDGTIECEVDATKLIPIDTPGDHEFVTEQYVREKASDDNDTHELRRVGVIKSVNAMERTACVRWLKPASKGDDPLEFDEEEIVSVYELEGHTHYDYCLGDVVVRLSPASLPFQLASSGSSVEETNQQSRPNEAKQDVGNPSGNKKPEYSPVGETSKTFADLSWVGHITGLKDGNIEVTWADGMVSMVGPQAVYVVGRDDDESIAAGSEASDDAASWETVDDDHIHASDIALEELRLENDSNSSSEAEKNLEISSGGNPALSLSLAALGFVTRLASEFLLRRRKNRDLIALDSMSEVHLQTEETINISEGRDSGDESSSQKSSATDDSGRESIHRKREEHVEAEAHEFSVASEGSCHLSPKERDCYIPCFEGDSRSFKRFDVAKDPLDHYFLGASVKDNYGRKWLKKVQQDWNILQNNLPGGICVRAYEDRMDLLRAAIVGAYGTPYQDGLFFFDFHLPPDYPDVPPSVYYRSSGWKINPNLYEEGKVCLSLLNTWTGRGNEVWDPVSSSILQVLVSLQGLVLNSRPYFNEAGYDKQVGTGEGEKNSLAYNENTFLLNCKTMMHLIRKPPKDFEELVRDHFRTRGHYILKACDAYMKGCLIGSLNEDASVSGKGNADSTSVGFKLMLSKIAPKLFSTLCEVGANCHEFKHFKQ